MFRILLIPTLLLFLGAPLFVMGAIDINTASSATLQTLPGIGPAKAEAIVDYREMNGLFASIAEIQNVSGIGPATYADIKSLITVSGSSNTDTGADPEEDNNTGSSSSSSDSSGDVSEQKQKIPIKGISIQAPDIAYVNQPIEFDVNPVKGSKGRYIRYRWNFGDTNTATTKSPAHSYAYPGEYVVMVESYYAKEANMARHKIEILPTVLSLSRTPQGDIQIQNNAEYEIRLGGYTLSADEAFTLPKYTVLLAQSALTVPRDHVENGVTMQVATLYDPAGVVVAAHSPFNTEEVALRLTDDTNTQNIDVRTQGTSAQHEGEDGENVAAPTSTNVTMPDSEMQVASAYAATERSPFAGKLPYLGLLGVLVVGALALYTKKVL